MRCTCIVFALYPCGLFRRYGKYRRRCKLKVIKCRLKLTAWCVRFIDLPIQCIYAFFQINLSARVFFKYIYIIFCCCYIVALSIGRYSIIRRIYIKAPVARIVLRPYRRYCVKVIVSCQICLEVVACNIFIVGTWGEAGIIYRPLPVIRIIHNSDIRRNCSTRVCFAFNFSCLRPRYSEICLRVGFFDFLLRFWRLDIIFYMRVYNPAVRFIKFNGCTADKRGIP